MKPYYRIIFMGMSLLFPSVVSAQTTINGIVRTPTEETLPGVAISEKGTTNGTITDLDGSYTIIVDSENAVLIFSFVGYEKTEIPVLGRTEINLTLQEEISDLEEMVVVGYGTQKRVNLSGAVDQVDGKVLRNRPISNAAQGLQGLIPNLNIQFNSGAPGESADINIRGITSINAIPEEKETNGLGEPLRYYKAGVFGQDVSVFLSHGDSGNIQITQDIGAFVEPKYYYRPIPQNEITLNPNLTQIFGWE